MLVAPNTKVTLAVSVLVRITIVDNSMDSNRVLALSEDDDFNWRDTNLMAWRLVGPDLAFEKS